jgi:hypothetical protein
MTDPRPNDTLQALWQSQSSEQPAMSLEQIREKARYLEQRVDRRNRREYIAAVLVVFAYGVILWRAPSAAVRIGAALILAATAVVCYRLRVHGSAASLQDNAGIESSLKLYCAQLERQRDLLRSVWLWFLLPFVPGFVVGLIGYARAQPNHQPATIVYGVLALILGIGLHVLNLRAAVRLQQVLDRLKDNG